MNEAATIAKQIKAMLPNVKAGTLRFWGVWLGRPHDNVHRLLECSANDEVLTMRFDNDEVLTVWSPKRLRLDASKFQIADAERVRWESFYYGGPKTEQNRFSYEFNKAGEFSVVANTNATGGLAEMRPRRWLPSVEIL
jgi:hypothetical protein